MKIAINGLLERIRNQYDRVLAFVAVSGLVATLIAIVIQFGAIRQSNEKFAREMRDLRPEREHVDTVADAAVLLVRQTLATPPELLVGEARTGWFFVPESRFSCAECGHPVPVASEDCPFCGALVTPPVPEEADHDGDGMPTLWEQQYGLDPHDPSDAHEDLDGDGFTNLEEFHYGTDPTDPQSHPPLIDWLIVDNVESQRFALQFRSRMRTPTGFRFGINYTLPNGSVKTDFVDIG
ncbi:MAG: Amuc_1099 family pilus-like system protein, partial [Kiritimatiellia bacterium]